MSKFSNNPIKEVTVPCLESVAAVLAAKLSALVFREFVRFDAMYFCTNATIFVAVYS